MGGSQQPKFLPRIVVCSTHSPSAIDVESADSLWAETAAFVRSTVDLSSLAFDRVLGRVSSADERAQLLRKTPSELEQLLHSEDRRSVNRWLLGGDDAFLTLEVSQRTGALVALLGPSVPALRYSSLGAHSAIAGALARWLEVTPSLNVTLEVPSDLHDSFLSSLSDRVRALIREETPTVEAIVARLERAITEKNESEARSAAEQYLFDRLQEVPETRGRFKLNVNTDLVRSKRAEVDLLDERDRIAIEIDGYFHFRDETAYRRDRRKDELLQSSDFLVLRFLATDVVSRIDTILSTVVTAVHERHNPETR